MAITRYLEDNAKKYPNDVALIEINPDVSNEKRVTWKEYSLVEPRFGSHYRKEITWKEFDDSANQMANLLLSRFVIR